MDKVACDLFEENLKKIIVWRDRDVKRQIWRF